MNSNIVKQNNNNKKKPRENENTQWISFRKCFFMFFLLLLFRYIWVGGSFCLAMFTWESNVLFFLSLLFDRVILYLVSEWSNIEKQPENKMNMNMKWILNFSYCHYLMIIIIYDFLFFVFFAQIQFISRSFLYLWTLFFLIRVQQNHHFYMLLNGRMDHCFLFFRLNVILLPFFIWFVYI